MPSAPQHGPRFVTDGAPVDIAVVIVTYNNATDIDGLLSSVRRDVAGLRVRVVVADNSSADDTVAVARAHDDVTVIRTGGNIGYAAGINAAGRHIGACDAILILNPDLEVEPGAVRALWDELHRDASVAAVVPRILDEDGTVYPSLRREPTLLRQSADSLLGRHWPGRPSFLTEFLRTSTPYGHAHDIEWSTGAALLVRTSAARRVGAWDERFFLYSEETDFFRRLRTGGGRIRYTPAATVRHRGGGSGASRDLVALMLVNRVRYMEKHHRYRAGVYRWILAFGEQLRRGDDSHSRARWALARRARWAELPAASRDRLDETSVPEGAASVIIAAHDEAAVIRRCLDPLAALAAEGRVEVIVSCNGCTDDTAAIAGSYPGVTVIESPLASKTAALNAADALARHWPRIYLDADIELTPRALVDTIAALGASSPALAARPAATTDTRRSDRAVRAYYRARERMASAEPVLWGAGVYALSQAGHARFATFPDIVADDLFVDGLFDAGEKAVVVTDPVRVSAPRTSRALVGILTRARRGAEELDVDTGSQTGKHLLRTVTGPASLSDALVYAGFALRARRRARSATATRWERDDSSRVAAASAGGTTIDHIVLTRFNLPTPGPERLVRAQEDWLRNRVELFERYTVASMRRQTAGTTPWIVYFDPESPRWLVDRLAPLVEAGVFTPLYRESVSWEDVVVDARELTGATRDILLTTNLDNDDALASDFLERLQTLARSNPHAALYLRRGLILEGDRLYDRTDRENAFCSVSEPWDGAVSAWRDWHNLLHRHFTVVGDAGQPAWLQVVHGQNVSNRVHGLLIDPAPYRTLFPGMLPATRPPRALVRRDRWVRGPVRAGRTLVRRTAKTVFLAVLGKNALDRLKEGIGAARRRGR